MVFKLHPQSEERKRSAVTLIKYLLAEKKPEVLPAHYRELLSTLLWKVTEADSCKYKTRFQTHGALGCSDKANLRHEHVFQRSKMIAALEKAAPHEVDDILIAVMEYAGVVIPLPVENCPLQHKCIP